MHLSRTPSSNPLAPTVAEKGCVAASRQRPNNGRTDRLCAQPPSQPGTEPRPGWAVKERRQAITSSVCLSVSRWRAPLSSPLVSLATVDITRPTRSPNQYSRALLVYIFLFFALSSSFIFLSPSENLSSPASRILPRIEPWTSWSRNFASNLHHHQLRKLRQKLHAFHHGRCRRFNRLCPAVSGRSSV